MHNYKSLIVWQESRKFTVEIYKLTEKFPQKELFGLTQQIRRAVVSIPSNIAEGAGRHADADFCRFLDIAKGSAFEFETQLLIANDLVYIAENLISGILLKIEEIQKSIST
ncbi:MAG: four helix bundle protein [Prevotellaceae bacterium]|jgi:four helix bundle protein|nr:four helix bundle protein [Prevotellaceae bacterium]